MQEINNISIAVLVCGLILLVVTIFLVVVGFQSKTNQKIKYCAFGTIYVIVLVSITICQGENHWMHYGANNVKVRIWASDSNDSRANIGVHLGLHGVNITLMSSERNLAFNEMFVWAWGTKQSMDDGSNPYRRTLAKAVAKGLPLPVQDMAESFVTYGILGSASPGIGLHEGGFYTDLCLTIGLGAWILAGLLPPLSLFAAFYSSLITCICITFGSLIYIIVNASYGNIKRSRMIYQSSDDDSKITVMLTYTWCFYINLLMIVMTGAMTYVIKQQATLNNAKQLRKLQLEIVETKTSPVIKNHNPIRRESSFDLAKRRGKFAKRRLTGVLSIKRNKPVRSGRHECADTDVIANITALPICHVVDDTANGTDLEAGDSIEMGSISPSSVHRESIKSTDVIQCDIDYTGTAKTMVYGVATAGSTGSANSLGVLTGSANSRPGKRTLSLPCTMPDILEAEDTVSLSDAVSEDQI